MLGLQDDQGLILEAEGLDLSFEKSTVSVKVLRGIDLIVQRGEVHALVGESGSGKTVTARVIMGLLPPTASLNAGSIRLEGVDLLGLDEDELRSIRGGEIAMIFQEPAKYLNPSLTVGEQIIEMLIVHEKLNRRLARERTRSLLGRVGLGSEDRVLKSYPHELSGGMQQRAMIAMAISCDPCLLIADEPTTALDVTIQRRILELLLNVNGKRSMSILFISHDLGAVQEIADTVSVIYAGKIVERIAATVLFTGNPTPPLHPYTLMLLASTPDPRRRGIPLQAIPGQVPDVENLPMGCAFHPRCPFAEERCRTIIPLLRQVGQDHLVACHLVE